MKQISLRLPKDEWAELHRLVSSIMNTDIPMSDNFVARVAIKAGVESIANNRSERQKGMPRKWTSRHSKNVPT